MSTSEWAGPCPGSCSWLGLLGTRLGACRVVDCRRQCACPLRLLAAVAAHHSTGGASCRPRLLCRAPAATLAAAAAAAGRSAQAPGMPAAPFIAPAACASVQGRGAAAGPTARRITSTSMGTGMRGMMGMYTARPAARAARRSTTAMALRTKKRREGMGTAAAAAPPARPPPGCAWSAACATTEGAT